MVAKTWQTFCCYCCAGFVTDCSAEDDDDLGDWEHGFSEFQRFSWLAQGQRVTC